MSPPEIIDLQSVDWLISGVNTQHYKSTVSVTDASITSLVRNLQIGQMAVLKFKEVFTDISNGTVICIPIFRNYNQILSLISLYGFGLIKDGRNLWVNGLMRTEPYILTIEIHCFGTPID